MLPQSRLRTLANSLLVGIENRRGRPFEVAGHQVRLLPGSDPQVELANASEHHHQHYDAIQLTRFAESIRPGDVVADVGGYRGEYTVVAAALVGDAGHVVAFERVGVNADFIRRNLDLNKLTVRTTVVEKAVSDKEGTATFFTSGWSSANSTLRGAIEPHAAGMVSEVTVATTTLDDFFRAYGRLPSVVKIDVEGAEFAVLRGADAIVRSQAIIFCELHPYAWPEAGHTGAELRAWLTERGRRIIALNADTEIVDFTYGPVRLLHAV